MTRPNRSMLGVPLSSSTSSVAIPLSPWTSNTQNAVVLIVDADESLRNGLGNLLESVGLKAKSFSSASQLLSMELPDVASCFVVDIRLPGVSGFELQSALNEANIRIPIIFITGHADTPMVVKAMKAGAVDFLTKPFREQEILDAVAQAIELDAMRLDSDRKASETFSRYGTLAQREREVMALVTAGLMNKQAAANMGIAECTVKIHRGQVMKKMGAKSLADLVRMAELIRWIRSPNSTLESFLHTTKDHRRRPTQWSFGPGEWSNPQLRR